MVRPNVTNDIFDSFMQAIDEPSPLHHYIHTHTQQLSVVCT